MFLPHELIVQILLRLPVKSLIRFKCVCKLWFSLISHDSNFANSHFQLNSATPTRRILFLSTYTHQTRSIDFEASLDNDSAAVSLNLRSIFPDSFQNFEIKGSCRGFILFCSRLNFYLWNPSTGLHKQIPLSPFGPNLYYANYLYGFGYDHSTDDYLVVSMSNNDPFDYTFYLEYFSLKANKWKQVEGPHFPYFIADEKHKAGLLYKGAIHCVAYHYDLEMNVILAFDLMERKLSYMPLPADFGECGLWVYGEFLGVYNEISVNDAVEIWVMKEYTVNSSWTKTLVLPIDYKKDVFCPLCCTRSGDIIGIDNTIMYGSLLMKYDKNGQHLEQHSYLTCDLSCEVTMYIDSLLSLPTDVTTS